MRAWSAISVLALVSGCGITETTRLDGEDAGGFGGFSGSTTFGGAAGFGGFPSGGGTAGVPSGGGTGGVPSGGGGAPPGGGGNAGAGGGGGTVEWTPASITGCVLWLDAADAASITAPASDLQGWTDKCGDHDGSSNGNGRPKVVPALLNGKPGVQFDGLDDLVQIGGTIVDTGSLTFFFVVSMDAGAQRAVWSNRGLVQGTSAPTFFGVSGGKAYLYQNGATPPLLATAIPLPSAPMLYELEIAPGSRRVLVDGNAVGNDAPTGSIATSVPIGLLAADQVNNVYLQMSLFEAVAFSGVLSAVDVATVRAKLKEKWALP